MKKDLQKQVEETLAALDGVQRAEVSPFLYSKIRNRMKEVNEYVPQSLAWRMVAALVIVALMNVFTIRHFNSEKKSVNGAESVASEYSIALPQTY